jgi:hypothetical protein
MLKGLSGILKSAAKIAAPFAGAALFPTMPFLGPALGSGIASLLAGEKPRDALISAGLSGLAGKAGVFGKATPAKVGFEPGMVDPGLARGVMEQTGNVATKPSFIQNLISKAKAPVFTSPDGKAFGPSGFTTAAMIGIPSALAYLGAAQDARRAQPMDPKDYRSYVDDLYGGPVARPPEDRRITNLNPLSNLPTGKADGGMMGGIPSYSAMDGSDAGIMAMAEGGQTFPRKTGMINGPGGPKEDKIPAMLSDGEFVFTAKAVDNAGGPKAMYRMMNRLDPESERPNERA